MKLSLLPLLICSALSFSVCAQPQSNIDSLAQKDGSYTAIIIKLKEKNYFAAEDVVTTQQTTNFLRISEPALRLTPLFSHGVTTRANQRELQDLDEHYGFDRYFRIDIPIEKEKDPQYINKLIKEIAQQENIETVYPESKPVSLLEIRGKKTVKTNKSTHLPKTNNASVPDFRDQQHYLKSPNDKLPEYRLGGVNHAAARGYSGGKGEDVTIISMESDPWNDQHINLPKISLSQATHMEPEDHDTASVGIMAAQDIGAGIIGLASDARMGYSGWQSADLYRMIPYLQAGDVVQIGMQTGGGEVTDSCTSECYVPQENAPAYYDVIKALTDKGVHVIQAAGNGNINLDHPGFNGKFTLEKRDSGAIIAGAVCANSAERASFSSFGSRVTSASWGCWDVTTTGYGQLYNMKNAEYTATFAGTSSANPIIAGVVASLSGIAKAHNIKISPVKMRELLAETGTLLEHNDSSKVGTQPDMARAIKKLLEHDPAEEIEPDEGVTINSVIATPIIQGHATLSIHVKATGNLTFEALIRDQTGHVNGVFRQPVTDKSQVVTLKLEQVKPGPHKLEYRAANQEDQFVSQGVMEFKLEESTKEESSVCYEIPAWEAKIYSVNGTKVQHNDALYSSKWWAGPQNEPGKAGPDGAPWQYINSCSATSKAR